MTFILEEPLTLLVLLNTSTFCESGCSCRYSAVSQKRRICKKQMFNSVHGRAASKTFAVLSRTSLFSIQIFISYIYTPLSGRILFAMSQLTTAWVNGSPRIAPNLRITYIEWPKEDVIQILWVHWYSDPGTDQSSDGVTIRESDVAISGAGHVISRVTLDG